MANCSYLHVNSIAWLPVGGDQEFESTLERLKLLCNLSRFALVI